ncbi:MAG: type II toxin-antitoxin system VapC family toxin [Quadrisphaera sp.]
MTLVYFDSSALVKLLVEEDGSDIAADLWDGCDLAVASRLAHVEVAAALAAARRAHRLTAGAFEQAQQLWSAFWPSVSPVELTAATSATAARIAAEHALRGADAVHLASLAAVGEDHCVMAVWDARLHAAAQTIGFRTAPARLG